MQPRTGNTTDPCHMLPQEQKVRVWNSETCLRSIQESIGGVKYGEWQKGPRIFLYVFISLDRVPIHITRRAKQKPKHAHETTYCLTHPVKQQWLYYIGTVSE
jgi:hypothetical protein